MHHVVLDRWSRGASAIHRRDPRAKIGALVVFLVVLATSHRGLPILSLSLLVMLCGVVAAARLPLARVLLRACFVFIFAAAPAVSSWISGEASLAVALVLKSYLSALAVLAVVSTTPMPDLLQGLESSGVPRFFLVVIQFLYRYLFVISEEAQHMRKAAAARGGAHFLAAAGAIAGLFARSYARAEAIHRAMLARGFSGNVGALHKLRFRLTDGIFVVTGSLAPMLLRAAAEKWS